MKLYRALLSAIFLLPVVATSALAQWQVPNFSTPQGRGSGKQGFDNFGPCLAGVPFVGAGVAAKGACGSEAISPLLSLGVGIVAKTASGTYAARTLQAPAAGFTITNPAGTAGDPTFVLANDLAALEALSTTGLAARTGTSTWATRTLTAPAAGITVTNGDGVAGNPTLVLANDLAALEGLGSTGYPKRTGTDTWSQLTASGILDDISTSNGAILCRSGGSWSVVASAASGVLTSAGSGNCPTYAAAGAGTVTNVATAGLATGGPITTTGTVTVTAATKSDQQTGTSTTTVVTPAQAQQHDSAAKAWVNFTGSSGTINASYNVTSVTRNGTGDYSINLTTAFATANYSCPLVYASSGGGVCTNNPSTNSASVVRVLCFNFVPAATDPLQVHAACFGRQ